MFTVLQYLFHFVRNKNIYNGTLDALKPAGGLDVVGFCLQRALVNKSMY